MTCLSAHAPDGSPVELYALLQPQAEPRIIRAAVPTPTEMLELGCGAGRLTRPLTEMGFDVVSVDQSAEMLAYVDTPKKILADIELLSLRHAFPVVLLASNLINTSDDGQRRDFLQTCRRHLTDDGQLLLQRLSPTILASADHTDTAVIGEVDIEMRDLEIVDSVISATAHYHLQNKEWIHRFKSRILDDAETEDELRRAELELDRWLDADKTWLAARPVNVRHPAGTE